MADPVMADMAEVVAARWAIPETAETGPPDDEAVDQLALALEQDLLGWIGSGDVEIGTRVTFGLLVVDFDGNEEEAESMVARLAATEHFSKLPAMFHTGFVSLDGLPVDATEADALALVVPQVRASVLKAVAVTAQEVQETPAFSLPVDILAGRSVHPEHLSPSPPIGPPSALQDRPDLASSTNDGSGFEVRPGVSHRDVMPLMGGGRWALTEAEQARAAEVVKRVEAQTGDRHTAEPDPRAFYEAFTPLRAANPPAAKTSLPARLHPELPVPTPGWSKARDRAREFFRGERTMSAAEQLNAIARTGLPVREVYVVMMGGGRHAGRKISYERSAATTEILKRLIELDEHDRERRWHVRLFTAGRALHAHPALPSSVRLTRKEVPQQWNEDPEVDECLDALRESLERASDSFGRRGIDDVSAVVMFLANELPTPVDIWLPTLVNFHRDVPAFWLLFTQKEKQLSNEVRAAALPLITFHDDAVDEVLHAVQTAWADPGTTAQAETATAQEPKPPVVELPADLPTVINVRGQ